MVRQKSGRRGRDVYRRADQLTTPWGAADRPPTFSTQIPACQIPDRRSLMPRLADKYRYWFLVLPALVIMIAFYIWPLLGIWQISLTEPKSGIENYTRMFDSSAVTTSFILTFRIAIMTTIGCLILGYIVAYVISNFARRAKPLMIALVLLPFWVSVLIRSFSWIVLLGRSGIVNDSLIGAGLIDSPLSLMHNE